jgi:hypothetical protein
MESLKEKNKKNARRFGMSKKRMVGLALGTVGLMGLVYSYVQAGSLTDNDKTSYTPAKVAKELVDAGNVTVKAAQIGLDNKVYKPTDIPLGSLIGPTISISVDKGKINVGTTGVAICNATDNATIANYQTGSGTNQLVFSSSSSTISNNISYWIGNSTCNGTAGLTFEIPQGSSSVTMTIKTGSATTQQVVDTASATIISVVPQFSASVGQKLSKQIDYTYDFKKFSDNTISDNGTITLRSSFSSSDIKVQDQASSNSTNFIVTLKPTDMAGIANATIDNGTSNATCNKGADKFICNATYDISSDPTSGNEFTIYVNVTGTDVLSERSFTVDALLDFVDSKAADQTLLTNVPFGEWKYKGTTIYIPLIGVNPTTGRETYIKLQSKDTSSNANKVKAIILASDGSTVTADLGQITAGQPFLIKGSDLAAKVQAAGKTVGDSFAAILVVTTEEANLFGYANIVDPSGAKRVPLKVRDGKIVE